MRYREVLSQKILSPSKTEISADLEKLFHNQNIRIGSNVAEIIGRYDGEIYRTFFQEIENGSVAEWQVRKKMLAS